MASITLRNVVARPLTNQEVDDNFNNLNIESSNTAANVGVLSNLSTTSKANIVSAINEVWKINANVGLLPALTTTNKSNIVYALNEVRSDLGNKSALSTPITSDLVSALNDVYSKASNNVNITGGIINGVTAVATSGNVTGNYFLGNGSLLTGISVDSTRIVSGTTDLSTVFNGGMVANVAGTQAYTIAIIGSTPTLIFYGNIISDVITSSNFQDGSGRTLKILDENDAVIWGD